MPHVIRPRARDLGGFQVARVLPMVTHRSVGPFVFFDHIGPARLSPGSPISVGPHPHIGLATVTYLWEGALMHRDSVGSVQEITPGDVNWMTAGRGIVHFERTPARLVDHEHALHGLQAWVALPLADEEVAPSFAHHPAASLPVVTLPGASLTVVAGHGFGARSPVVVFTPTLYVSIELEAGASLEIPAEHSERALYPVAGALTLDGVAMEINTMTVLDPETTPVLRATAPTRLMLIGGAPLDAPRHMWWNFVSSSQGRIEQAKQDWRADRFGHVPGEHGRIEAPER